MGATEATGGLLRVKVVKDVDAEDEVGELSKSGKKIKNKDVKKINIL